MVTSEYPVHVSYRMDDKIISLALRADYDNDPMEKQYFILKGNGPNLPGEGEIGPFDSETAMQRIHEEIALLKAMGYQKIQSTTR